MIHKILFYYTPDFIFYILTLVHDRHWYLSFCEKIVKTSDKAICCDLCSNWIHIKCKYLNDLDYEYLGKLGNDETWYCKTCIHEILPFCNKNINPNKTNLGNVGIGPNLKKFLCQLNNLSGKENNDNENLINCTYRDISIAFHSFISIQIHFQKNLIILTIWLTN